MQDDPSQKNLPAESDSASSGDERGGNHLYVNHLNYHANDLAELRRLAETDPELARVIVENQERQSARTEGSYRLGLVVAGLLAISLVAGGAFIVVKLGWWQTFAFVLVLLGVSHVLSAVLKGEFSETSWIGGFFKGKPDNTEE